MKTKLLFWFATFVLTGFLLAALYSCSDDEIDKVENTVTDIDGNVYRTVIIGDREWMAENLRVTRYHNGNAIPTDLNNTQWAETTEGAFAIYPHGSIPGLNTDEKVLEAYGALYNWYAVNTAVLCPEGWSVPSHDEFKQLVDYVVSQGYPNHYSNPIGAGHALKSCWQVGSPLGGDCDTSEHPRWKSQSTRHGFNEFEFSALPGGQRLPNADYDGIGDNGHLWSSSEGSATAAWGRYFGSYGGSMISSGYNNRHGFSVRCVRNIE